MAVPATGGIILPPRHSRRPTLPMNDFLDLTLSTDPVQALRQRRFAIVTPAALANIVGISTANLDLLRPSWDDLPPDRHLRDGGAYRFRRHACYLQELDADGSDIHLNPVPHRAHWQPTSYNALHGGIERWFEPVTAAVAGATGWQALLGRIGELFAQVAPQPRWFIEAHQFRIDTAAGGGRPTPEGAHRDGVDFVAVILIDRHHVRGGETRVFDVDGPHGIRFVMEQPWTTVLLDDAKVIHETTPIQPDAPGGYRDTLVLTYRAGGFQAP